MAYKAIIWIGAGISMACAALASPFSLDQAGGRLPKNVVPVHYRIAVVPDIEARTIHGTEIIDLTFRSATDTIQFNSLNETLTDVRFDGQSVKNVVSDDGTQLTTLTLKAPAKVGSHHLRFAYAGKIESAPNGLFAQPYKNAKGAPGLLLSTQMEATDARRMFPCWDEPAFRATFDLTVTTPASWQSVGNMPIAKRVVKGTLATTTFQTTPKMPSYLVEFTAGDLGHIDADEGATHFGVWAVRGSEQDGALALADAQTILRDYNDYFGYAYPLPKLDSIAVPGGFQGAMENWGAITYNDQALLVTSSSSIANRQEVFSIQAHEMAHQWNGDLVTMAWWDDIWLNESFASWMAAKETALRHPDWQWLEAQDESKESAMAADARSTSHAIQQHVVDEMQAASAFDSEITYNKGEAILRMFEAYLGPDTFRAGIRAYMREFAYSNATTSDLWRSLGAISGKDITAMVGGWTAQPGYPLVQVAANCDAAGARTLTLSQQRFLSQGSAPAQSPWQVPLQIRVGADAVAMPLLLTDDNQKVAAGRCDQALSLNAGALGFFRTRYDAATLKVNTAQFAHLPSSDQIALLDDQWAMTGVGMQPLAAYLALAADLGDTLDARAWVQVAESLGVIEYALRDTDKHDAFARRARLLLAPVYRQLGLSRKAGETPDIQILRTTAVEELADLGDPAVIEESRRRFAAFIKDHAAVSADDQEAMLYVVAQYADAATYDELHAVAKGSANETEVRRYYWALMQVADGTLAQQSLQIALSSEIPAQAEAMRLDLVLSLSGRHQQLAWQGIRENIDRLLAPFGSQGPLYIAQALPTNFWRGIPLPDIDTWVRAHAPQSLQVNIERGMESARFRVARKERLSREVDAYLRTS